MPAARDDRSLIEGCLAGRREAWDTFVERYSKLIFWAIGRAFEKTPFQARSDLRQEIFQEVFCRLLEKDKLRALRDVHSAGKFLSVLAFHAAKDRLRVLAEKEGRFEVTAPGGAEEGAGLEALPDAGASDPAASAQRREVGGFLEEAMRSLEAEERFCVELCYGDGKTHQEIAEIVGKPVNTVSSVIRRAKDKLRQKLEKKGYGL